MPSRAAHTKSRSGCLRCKQRRVKCDEGQPCRDCNRRGEFCSLVTDPVYIASFKDGATLAGASPASTGSGPGSAGPSASPSIAAVPPVRHAMFSDFPASQLPLHQAAPYADWAEDLHLMAHWTVTACHTIMQRPSVTTLYQRIGPEVAVNFPSAMHIMLCISALHLAYLRPDDRAKYISMSSRHQQHAIHHLSTAIQNITKETIIPIFLSSALLPIACLADMCLARHNPESPPTLDDLLSVFSMTRGVRDILYPVWPWLSEPEIAPVIAPIVDRYILHDNESLTLPSPLAARMETLRNSLLEKQTSYHDGSKEACHFALLELEKVMRDIAHMPPSHDGYYDKDYRKRRDVELGVLMKWQTMVSATYVGLLKKGHVAALVILAHWIGLTKHMGGKWFLEGYVGTGLGLIRGRLKEEDRHWLEWPEEYVREGEDSILTG